MGRGGAIYLSYSALVLLSTASGTLARDGVNSGVGFGGATATCPFCNLWPIWIDNGPPPSPENGPPLSANAIRNKAILPYEVIAIVCSYVLTVLILGTLLLTVGRRLRKRAQTMAERPQELVKPMRKQFDPSPISPRSMKSWYSLRRKRSGSIRSGASQLNSPGMDSVVSFDTSVVEADKRKQQEQMEMLYAAVMAEDDRKTKSQTTLAMAPPEYQRKLPSIITDAPHMRHMHTSQMSPRSPVSMKSPVRAIYPPNLPMSSGPLSPTRPGRESGDLRANRSTRASSLGSRSAADPAPEATGGKKLRKGLRNLKISAPLHADDNSDGARTPLSPRYYTDPGVPPEPPTARTIDTTRTGQSDYYPPNTPGTARTDASWRYPDEDDRGDDTEPAEEEQQEEEVLDQVRDLPQPHPNRLNTHNYSNQAQALTDAASMRPDPTGTTPQNKRGAASASDPSRPLPFRALNLLQEQQRAAAAAAYPLSPMSWQHQHAPGQLQVPMSAGPGQTQFVSPRRDRFAPGIRTGMATPYSPYMPYTPVTPITPHLTTRVERRQREREERRGRGAITEEEAVVDEGELWSSGY
ncbi:hypothetical protein BAUCODRAFT_32542 [Baudoinia panamericana UAMH 10762]|uniref:Uncharacterized protein n=1 Tax=Baudoinia panamericana (strain UAMH 10762) TaxID=717646 RepID=M2MP76_BAUPA|nr:uncharacterized protein BAUCODRAFT_32542 [Baudoinia panamericana UAMH 10762]EMC98496.1 hypothetical protein BAUCODRAFT_32542 [Baudoinia panamericana UAMH 10762]